MLAAAFRAFNDSFVRVWTERAKKDSPPTERLAALITLFGTARSDWEPSSLWAVFVEYWSLCWRDSTVAAEDAQARDVYATPIRRVIEDGIADGTFTPRAPTEDVVDTLLACVDGLLTRSLLEPERMPQSRLIPLVARIAASKSVSISSPSRAGRTPCSAALSPVPRRSLRRG